MDKMNFKKCFECREKFYIESIQEYAYKRKVGPGRTGYFCCWTCFRKRDKRKR